MRMSQYWRPWRCSQPRPSSPESWVFNLNNACSPYPHVTPKDLAELRYAASLRRGASMQTPQADAIQEAGR